VHAGERFRRRVPDSTSFVRSLFAAEGAAGDAIGELEVRRASLEDTYLALVRQAEDIHGAASLGGAA
jgi:ABC-2 type transport system ATP-binding protein